MKRPLYKKKSALLLFSSAAVFSLLALAAAVLPAPAQAACSALPSGKGTVTMTISVPSAGTYRVWARELAPSTNANGFYLQIADAGACQVTMGDAAIPVNTWTWVDYQNGTASSKVNATLSAGNHTVVLAGLDDTVEVDKIILLSDASCTPTGDGSNCTSAAATTTPTPTPTGGGSTPTPTPTPISLPAPGTTSNSQPATVSKTISIPVPAGAKNAQCYIDGKAVNCSSVDTTKLSDGNHAVEVKTTDASGKTIDQKTTIKVKNKQTLQEQIVAGLQKYKLPLSLLAGVLVLGSLGLIIYHRISRSHVHSNLTTSPPVPGASPITNPSNLTSYPDEPPKPPLS